jgi:hypothetical protein
MVIGELDPSVETLAILGDSETVRRLVQSDAELACGQEISATELAASLHQRG